MQVETGGWGVILGEGIGRETMESLKLLLDHRRTEAGDLYREFSLISRTESAYEFLLRNGVGPGLASPQRVPYYLLIVGGPDKIPFSFQYELGVQYGVGRIVFEHLKGYENYATSVVASETRDRLPKRRLVVFAPGNRRDRISQLHFNLALRLEAFLSHDFPLWDTTRLDHAEATKLSLADILSDKRRLPLLLVLSHGAMFDSGHPLQASSQGGILCNEFYVNNAHGRADDMSSDVMFSASDIDVLTRANVDILFLDACNSAGTSEFDDRPSAPIEERKRLAPADCLAPLPLGLLSFSSDGPLAVVGHVNGPTCSTFNWNGLWTESQTYEVVLSRLLEGDPVGFAVKPHSRKYAEILAMLHPANSSKERSGMSEVAVEDLYTLAIGERNLVVLGDPASRLRV